MNDIRQGDIWWSEADGRRRPVLIVSRSEAAGRLNRLVVAPITRTVRSIPTNIVLDADDGMDVECAASFDNLFPQAVSMLTERIGTLAFPRGRICAALEALADC